MAVFHAISPTWVLMCLRGLARIQLPLEVFLKECQPPCLLRHNESFQMPAIHFFSVYNPTARRCELFDKTNNMSQLLPYSVTFLSAWPPSYDLSLY